MAIREFNPRREQSVAALKHKFLPQFKCVSHILLLTWYGKCWISLTSPVVFNSLHINILYKSFWNLALMWLPSMSRWVLLCTFLKIDIFRGKTLFLIVALVSSEGRIRLEVDKSIWIDCHLDIPSPSPVHRNCVSSTSWWRFLWIFGVFLELWPSQNKL